MSNKTVYLIGTFVLTFLVTGSASVGGVIASAAPAAPNVWALLAAVGSALGASGIATQKLLEPPPT